MDFIQIALGLAKMTVNSSFVYLKAEPEILDFTDKSKNLKIIISSKTDEMTIPLDKDNLLNLLGILSSAIFNKDICLLCWNIKNLFSYIKYETNSDLNFDCKVFDLKVVENFLGTQGKMPKTYNDAMVRLKNIRQDELYDKSLEIYNQIHLPLITKIIPSLETEGIIDKEKRKHLHSYYEIEGQVNGRLSCHMAFKDSFNPHSIGPEERKSLRPRMKNSVFMYVDFKHMEVTTLHWLTKEKSLGDMLSSEDFYSTFYKLLTGAECDNEDKRDLSKKMFLPVVYGQQANSLSEELNISINTAEKIISKINSLFPLTMSWLSERQKNRICVDVLGRRRVIEDRFHRIRNFQIQSPAAIVCLEKLIKLFDAVKDYARILCNIHDGFVLAVDKANINMVWSIAKSVLESESELCEGLKLKAAYKYGENLPE